MRGSQEFQKLSVNMAGGIFLVFVGALLLMNYFTLLSAYPLRLTPRWLW